MLLGLNKAETQHSSPALSNERHIDASAWRWASLLSTFDPLWMTTRALPRSLTTFFHSSMKEAGCIDWIAETSEDVMFTWADTSLAYRWMDRLQLAPAKSFWFRFIAWNCNVLVLTCCRFRIWLSFTPRTFSKTEFRALASLSSERVWSNSSLNADSSSVSSAFLAFCRSRKRFWAWRFFTTAPSLLPSETGGIRDWGAAPTALVGSASIKMLSKPGRWVVTFVAGTSKLDISAPVSNPSMRSGICGLKISKLVFELSIIPSWPGSGRPKEPASKIIFLQFGRDRVRNPSCITLNVAMHSNVRIIDSKSPCLTH